MAECSLLPAWPCQVLKILLIGSPVPNSSQIREFTRSIIGALAAHCGRMTGYAEVILILDLPFSGLSNLRPTPASWTRSTDLPPGSGRFFPKMGYGAPLQGQTS